MKKILEPPCTGGPKLLHGSIGTYRKSKKKKKKKKNENSDYVSILVKMGSTEPQTNPMAFKIKLTNNFLPH